MPITKPIMFSVPIPYPKVVTGVLTVLANQYLIKLCEIKYKVTPPPYSGPTIVSHHTIPSLAFSSIILYRYFATELPSQENNLEKGVRN